MVGRWDYLDSFKNRPFKRQSKEQLFQEYVDTLIARGRQYGCAIFLKDNLFWPEKLQEFTTR